MEAVAVTGNIAQIDGLLEGMRNVDLATQAEAGVWAHTQVGHPSEQLSLVVGSHLSKSTLPLSFGGDAGLGLHLSCFFENLKLNIIK